MGDQVVIVQPDSTGKKVDVTELTRDSGVVVERQRMVLASDSNPILQAQLDGEVGRVYLLIDSNGFNELVEKMDEIIYHLQKLTGAE